MREGDARKGPGERLGARPATDGSIKDDRGGLEGRVVVVTGAAGGLGRAYARRLAGRGARLALVDIQAAAAEIAAGDLRAVGGTAHAIAADVTDPVSVRAMHEEVVRRLGPVKVLINNAGGNVAPPGPMEAFGYDAWLQNLALNLTSAWLCSQAVVPAMKSAGGGKIINIATAMTFQGLPTGFAAYSAAKAGVVGMTRALARELGAFGVTVNAVAPGLIPIDKPEQGEARAQLLRSMAHEVVARQSLRRPGQPEDLCGVIEFLVSDASNFITGQVCVVDGGEVFC